MPAAPWVRTVQKTFGFPTGRSAFQANRLRDAFDVEPGAFHSRSARVDLPFRLGHPVKARCAGAFGVFRHTGDLPRVGSSRRSGAPSEAPSVDRLHAR